jgi:adenylosuccinate lyase
VAGGLEVHPARITARVRDELPFMATEELIVRAVRAGKSRQDAHEVIRVHSIAAARAMKDEGVANDMLERLTARPGVRRRHGRHHFAALDASRFIGSCPATGRRLPRRGGRSPPRPHSMLPPSEEVRV